VFFWPARPDESSSRTDHRLSRWRACHRRCKRALRVLAGIRLPPRISFASPSLPLADARRAILLRTSRISLLIISQYDSIRFIAIRCQKQIRKRPSLRLVLSYECGTPAVFKSGGWPSLWFELRGPILDDFQRRGFRPFFTGAPEFLNRLRSIQAIDTRQNPHPSKLEGWGTQTSKL
jgi:hypothetical protein